MTSKATGIGRPNAATIATSPWSLALDQLDHAEDTERLRIGDVAPLISGDTCQPDGVAFIPADRVDKAAAPGNTGADDNPAMGNARRPGILMPAGPEAAAQARVCVVRAAPVEAEQIAAFR